MDRSTWNETFMNVCDVMSKRSTCCKLQTGCIIVRDRNIISTGYNGVPHNLTHCNDIWLEFYKTMIAKAKNNIIVSENKFFCTKEELEKCGIYMDNSINIHNLKDLYFPPITKLVPSRGRREIKLYNDKERDELISIRKQIFNMYYDFVENLQFNEEDILKYSIFDEFTKGTEFRKLHHYWSLKNENHAEMNAICQAGNSLQGTTLYTLYSPCIQCAKVIASAGILKVYYKEIYARDIESATKFLQNCGVSVEYYN